MGSIRLPTICALASGALAWSLLGAPIASASSSLPSRPVIAPGTNLTTTTLGGYTQINQIDMLSPHVGYAIASGSLGKGHFSDYLVRTTDLGKTWTVRSRVSANLSSYPFFFDFAASNTDPAIDFLNARVGYVDGAGGSLDVTSDGGRTFDQITPANGFTSYVVSGLTTSVVVSNCPRGATTSANTCKSEFFLYRSGATTPILSSSIPTAQTRYEPGVGLLAATPQGVEVVNVDSGNPTTASSLRISHNFGRTWSPLTNPCVKLPIEQLLVSSRGTWMLSCFLDEGMSQGPGKLLRSINDGRTWTTEFNDPLPVNGTVGPSDTPMTLYFNGNGEALYAAYLNPAGGLAVSTNFGRSFTPLRYVGYTGGAPGLVSSFGPTSLIYQVERGPAFITRDGQTWKLLPQLRAGHYKNSSICASRTTHVHWRSARSGGLTYTFLDFTNESTHACYLNGAPVVRALGASSRPVSPPITTEFYTDGGGFVVLRAHGGVASVGLLVSPTSSVRGPTWHCAPETAQGLRVSFASPSHFLFVLGSHKFKVCTTMPSLNVTPVRSGRGRP